ncbi:MAG: peroxiredoxin family protein [Candidatus Latescibacterota bacterium]
MKNICVGCLLFLVWGVTTVWAEDAKKMEGVDKTNFVVHEADGDGVFKLSDAKGKYVALHFLLKTACPYCIRHTIDYAWRANEVPEAVHVFLKPDTDEEIKEWSVKLDQKNQSGENVADDLPVIYRDTEAGLAKAFDIPFGYKFHGQVVHYPALVILDPKGKEVFRYVGKNNGDRYDFDDFVAKIAELKKKK